MTARNVLQLVFIALALYQGIAVVRAHVMRNQEEYKEGNLETAEDKAAADELLQVDDKADQGPYVAMPQGYQPVAGMAQPAMPNAMPQQMPQQMPAYVVPSGAMPQQPMPPTMVAAQPYAGAPAQIAPQVVQVQPMGQQYGVAPPQVAPQVYPPQAYAPQGYAYPPPQALQPVYQVTPPEYQAAAPVNPQGYVYQGYAPQQPAPQMQPAAPVPLVPTAQNLAPPAAVAPQQPAAVAPQPQTQPQQSAPPAATPPQPKPAAPPAAALPKPAAKPEKEPLEKEMGPETPADDEMPAKRRTVVMVIIGSFNVVLAVWFFRRNFAGSKYLANSALFNQQRAQETPAHSGVEESKFRPRNEPRFPVAHTRPLYSESSSSEGSPEQETRQTPEPGAVI